MKNVTVLQINAVTCRGMMVPSNLFVGPTSNLLHEENKFRIILWWLLSHTQTCPHKYEPQIPYTLLIVSSVISTSVSWSPRWGRELLGWSLSIVLGQQFSWISRRRVWARGSARMGGLHPSEWHVQPEPLLQLSLPGDAPVSCGQGEGGNARQQQGVPGCLGSAAG